jgi:hypothetical protein
MSDIDHINISVFPCANGGYMVVAIVNEKEKKPVVPEVPEGFLLFGMRQKPEDQIRIYAPDSQHVGMAIQEIIDGATVKAGKE